MPVTELEFDAGQLVAEALWKSLTFAVHYRKTADRDLEITVTSAEKVEEPIRSALEPALKKLSRSALDGMRAFLASGELQTAVRQTLALRIVRGKGNFLTESKPITATIGSSMRMYVKRAPIELAQIIQQAIAQACDIYVKSHGRQLHRLLQDPIGLAYLNSQIESIAKITDVFADADSIESFTQFIETYTVAATDAFARVRAPHWDAQVVVPLSKVYIPPRLASNETHRTKNLTLRLDRTVIVGDPGAGKTTYTSYLAYNVLKNQDRRFEPSTIPLVLTLRDYSTPESAGRFEENIEHSLKARFHAAPPRGVVRFMLLSGRAFIIFDGLDELLVTSLRRHIVDSIEGFAASYPNVSIVVTSRIVGYDQAPLDPAVFATYRILPFAKEEVEKYSFSWFTLDKWAGEPGNPYDRHVAFMRTSSTVSDLRSNPLLLALLCNLYKATGYQELPRSRPAVLEKCALMLFDRWDRHRSIGNIDFERDFQPVVAWLAFKIFSDQALAAGVPETRFISLAVEFLYPARMHSEDSAIAFSRSLLDHCKGRAWVLTDIGTTSSGEPIYQFTHRTFLEYYAALHVFRRFRTPEEVVRELRPYIEAAEWGLVPILAVQIMDRWLDGASDDVIAAVLQHRPSDLQQLTNTVLFTVEVLRTVAVGPNSAHLVGKSCGQLLGTEKSLTLEAIQRDRNRPLISENVTGFEAGYRSVVQHVT
jgi:NACHT domain